MRKLIAKTQEGKEFLHSKTNAFFCDRSAQKIADSLNTSRYKLQDGEKWHVYDYDFMQDTYVTQCIYMTSNGSIKAKSL